MKALRLDQEGCHTDKKFVTWIGSRSILLDYVARDAHNELAIVEKHIDILKEIMSRTAAASDPQDTPKEIREQAIDAMNDLARYRGHSPYEMMLGRTPELDTATIMGDGENLPLMNKLADEADDDDGDVFQ